MFDGTYTVIFHTSSNPIFLETGLTVQEVEFCCKAYLDKGEWVEAVIIETNQKISYEQEQDHER